MKPRPRQTLLEETRSWRARILAACESNQDLMAKCEVKDRQAVSYLIDNWSDHVMHHVSQGYDPKLAVSQVVCWALLLGGHLEREGLL